MSLAIRRKDINRKLYFNKADPRQATAVTGIDPMFEERHARKYAEYKPDKARKLLDEVGLKDLNGDGVRQMPDGTSFNPQLLYTEIGKDLTAMLEIR